jgi:hypothetical protein
MYKIQYKNKIQLDYIINTLLNYKRGDIQTLN